MFWPDSRAQESCPRDFSAALKESRRVDTEQAQLGDFWIPQRGVLAFGRASFASGATSG